VAHFKPVGIKKPKGSSDDMTVPEFAMPPDAVPGIAQVIVNIWSGAAGLDKIMDRYDSGPKRGMATGDAVAQATTAINAAAPGFNLKRCVIINESEHDDGYTMEDPNDVVFVLPNSERVDLAGANLLASAKLLMACTPNGI
jgi:hypothetical protein